MDKVICRMFTDRFKHITGRADTENKVFSHLVLFYSLIMGLVQE